MPYPTREAEPRADRSTLAGPFLIDAHVHFHGCFDPERFFDGARANFREASQKLGFSRPALGCLLFTESRADHFFARFRESVGDDRRVGWRFHATGEDCSLRATAAAGEPLILIAGRQIVTREKLEVLALGTARDFEDGMPIRETLERVHAADAIPVLPWGFGKWWLRRGRIITALIEAGLPDRVFLGDNAGRPRLSLRPPKFAKGEARQMYVLPGSDPLPFPQQANRAGGYGCSIEADLDENRPAESLKNILRALTTPPRTFGTLAPLGDFVRSQAAMQLRKRLR